MDYRTYPTTRKNIRTISNKMREFFGYGKDEKINPLLCLDRVGEIIEGSIYEVVDDDKLPYNVPAECKSRKDKSYKILIKESVYKKAYENNDEASRDYIMHEICHLFMFALGYTPIIERSFNNCELKAYESVEWQAKALCGEFMIPYEYSKNMSMLEIMEKYGVSASQANYRISLKE